MDRAPAYGAGPPIRKMGVIPFTRPGYNTGSPELHWSIQGGCRRRGRDPYRSVVISRKETSTLWQKWTGAPQRSGNSQPVAECDLFTNPGYGPEPCLRGRTSLQEGGRDALSPVPGINPVRARISTSHTGLTEALRPRLHHHCFVLHGRLLFLTVVSTGYAPPG